MRLIKRIVRRVLATLGYTIVTTAWLEQFQQSFTRASGTLGRIESSVGELRTEFAAIRGEISTVQRELAQTKGGVSALQGESGESLSNMLVMRQELLQLFERISTQAAHPKDADSPASQSLLVATRILSLPRKLEDLATQLTRDTEASEIQPMAHMLAQHYLQMADLVALHWVNDVHLPDDPYPDDDLTLSKAKRIGAFVPDADVDIANECSQLPWRALWSDPRCATILVLGNGTAANQGEVRRSSKREVYNFDAFRLHCTKANDPLAGASGSKGSIWTRLGDQLVENGLSQRVIFVPLAFSGSQITDWVPDGPQHCRLALALSRLRKQLVTPILPFSAVLWHPGDAALSEAAYKLHCHDVIADLRANGIFAPIIVAAANEICPPKNNEHSIVVDPASGVFAGPALGEAIGRKGQVWSIDVDHAAELWLNVLSSYWPLLTRPSL